MHEVLQRPVGTAGRAEQAARHIVEVQACLAPGRVQRPHRAPAQAGRGALDREQVDLATSPAVAVAASTTATATAGAGCHEEEIGVQPVEDEHLRPPQPPSRRIVGSRSGHAHRIPANRLLGERDGRDGMAGRDTRQVVLARGLVVQMQQDTGGEHGGGQVRRAQQGAPHLLQDDADLADTCPGPAVLLGDEQADDTQLARQPRPDLPVEAFRRLHQTPDLGLRGVFRQELPDGVP